jgi:hypothetical protein
MPYIEEKRVSNQPLSYIKFLFPLISGLDQEKAQTKHEHQHT